MTPPIAGALDTGLALCYLIYPTRTTQGADYCIEQGIGVNGTGLLTAGGVEMDVQVTI
jgi:hypothetical protein